MSPSPDPLPPGAPAPLPEFATRNAGLTAALAILIGAGGVLLFVAIFVVTLLLPGDKPAATMPGVLGGTAWLPAVALFGGIALLRAPQRVIVHDDALEVRGALAARRRFAWEDIASIRRGKDSSIFGTWSSLATPSRSSLTRDVLTLLDARGKTLVKLTSSLSSFPTLAAEIEARSSAAQGRPTYDAEASIAARRRGARRGSILIGALCLALGSMMFVGAITLGDSKRHFLENAVPAAGRFTAARPFMGNHKVTYEFRDGHGHLVTRDAVATRATLETITAGDGSVEVMHLPDDPETNYLAHGDLAYPKPGDDLPKPLVYGVGGGMALLGAVLLLSGVLGIADLKLKDGRLTLVRTRDLTDEFEATTADAAAASQCAGSGPPDAHASPHPAPASMAPLPVRAAPRRPPGVTAFGVINIVYGGVSVLVNTCAAGGLVLLLTNPGALPGVSYDAGPAAYLDIGAAVLHVVTAALLILAGVCLLARRPAGRVLSLVAAALLLCLNIGGLIVRAVTLADAARPEDHIGDAVAAGTAAGLAIDVLTLVYPCVLLALLWGRPWRAINRA